MAEVDHIASIGNPQMDTVMQDIVTRLLTALPSRLRAVYVLGSYADASAVPTSDLDLVFLVGGRMHDGEREQIRALLAKWTAAVEGELDIEVEDEAGLKVGVSPTLKLGSRLLWGVDVCQNLEIMQLPIWTRDRMHTSYWRLAGLFARPLPLSAPLEFPDSSDEFFGYIRRRTHLPDGQLVPGTRDLVRAVGWMATALLAYQTGQYVATKRACARMYREHIGDEWATLLDHLAEWVRGAWQYRIPTAPNDRARLREICVRTLGFENHFLTRYRRYALGELQGDDPLGRQQAIDALNRIPLADAELVEAKMATEQHRDIR